MDVSGVQWTLYEVAKGVGWIVFAWSEESLASSTATDYSDDLREPLVRLLVYVVPTGSLALLLLGWLLGEAAPGHSRPFPPFFTRTSGTIGISELQTMHGTQERRYSKWLSTSTVIECWLS